MATKDIINQVKAFFSIKELVSKEVYAKLGERAWELFDPRLLANLLVLRRDILKIPLVCNNWNAGGSLSQRGYRENICQIVKDKTMNGTLYLSGHTTGQALDLSSGKMSADEMRKLIKDNAQKLPYGMRIENGKDAPTWLHIDVKTLEGLSEF